MKINAFRGRDAKFTADLWKVTISTDAEGGSVFSHAFDRKISLTANTGSFGKLEIWLGDDCADMVALDHLFNLFGPDGNELATNSVWQVDVIAPYLNMWGHREGFKARISMVAVDA
jgi:hypothetical protein